MTMNKEAKKKNQLLRALKRKWNHFRNSRHIGIYLLVTLLIALALGFFLVRMQAYITRNDELDSAASKLQTVSSLLTERAEQADRIAAIYDDLYESRLEAVSLLLYDGWEPNETHLAEMQELLGGICVAIVDDSGTVLCASAKPAADFSRARFNQLRTADENGFTVPFCMEKGECVYRYFGLWLEQKYWVVL